MPDHPEPLDIEDQSQEDEEPAPGLLDSVLGRLIAVSMAALIVAGVIAIVVILNNRDEASANQRPSERLLDRDFAVTGSSVLSINPAVVSGACPAEVHLTAEIQTTGAEGTLVYRWHFDDAGPTEPETLELESGQTSILVELTTQVGGPAGKYQGLGEQVSIQVLEQDGEQIPVASRKSSFTIACGS
jgi:hypothetical protein